MGEDFAVVCALTCLGVLGIGIICEVFVIVDVEGGSRWKFEEKSKFARDEVVPNLDVLVDNGGAGYTLSVGEGFIVACILARDDAVGAYSVDERLRSGALFSIVEGGRGAGLACRMISA